MSRLEAVEDIRRKRGILPAALKAAYEKRERMHREAAQRFEKEFGKPDKMPPFQITGSDQNLRELLKSKQLEDSSLIQQKDDMTNPKKTKQKGTIEGTEDYRVHKDGVLEKQVVIAKEKIWVPVLPAEPVVGPGGSQSWGEWAFGVCHNSFLNPH